MMIIMMNKSDNKSAIETSTGPRETLLPLQLGAKIDEIVKNIGKTLEIHVFWVGHWPPVAKTNCFMGLLSHMLKKLMLCSVFGGASPGAADVTPLHRFSNKSARTPEE